MPIRPSTVPDLGAQGLSTLKPQMATEGPCSIAGLERFLADYRGETGPKSAVLGTEKSPSSYSSEVLCLLGWGSSLSMSLCMADSRTT